MPAEYAEPDARRWYRPAPPCACPDDVRGLPGTWRASRRLEVQLVPDFGVDLATSERLGAAIPNGAIKVAESGIKSSRDVARLAAAGFHAFLVGESLLRQNDRAAAVRALTPE